jgi:hypothetical protein
MKDEGDDGVWRERAGILVDHLVTVKKRPKTHRKAGAHQRLLAG